MAKKPAAAKPSTSAHESQVDFLILSIMSAVVPMIESKCGTLNKRDQNTLKRHIEKAVRGLCGRGDPCRHLRTRLRMADLLLSSVASELILRNRRLDCGQQTIPKL